MARKFLYLVAGLIVLVLAGMFALRLWSEELSELAFVPDTRFEAQPAVAANAYADPAMWYARPGMSGANPALWQPQGYAEDADALGAAVFFVHPTSYLGKEHWNGPLDDAKARELALVLIRGAASPFNKNPAIWAPRYRQAAFGAFLSDAPAAARALDLAYGDIDMAFAEFLRAIAKDQPIILAGHSQGAFHLKRLIKDRVAATPLARRVVAAYLIGWPVSPRQDLPAMAMPACSAPDQTGCVISWMTFAEPADTAMMERAYARRMALDGKPLDRGDFLCSNPLTGMPGGAAAATANHGTLTPDKTMTSFSLVAGQIPARCGKRGLLYIGDPPALGPYVLPGNNYHVYDVPLFWLNTRRDVERRVRAWKP